jgi:DNA-directed RNA polymerase specialized sigma24 family protein
MPPIDHLQRVPEYHLDALLRQGIFTTGLLLEVSETSTRRQYLADQIGATPNDVNAWRDEALLLNLANLGPDEQRLFTQAEIVGLADLLALDLDTFRLRLQRAARALGVAPPEDVIVEGWWDQAHTLREE